VTNADPTIVSHCSDDIFCIIDYIALGEEAADAYLGDPALEIPLQQTSSTDIDIVLQGKLHIATSLAASSRVKTHPFR